MAPNVYSSSPRLAASRDALAELAILERYDAMRSSAGHDYGAGQRAAELARRRRPFRDAGMDAVSLAATLEPAELARAFQSVGAPRVRRVELETFRRETPATRRTRETWRRVERIYSGEAR